MRARGVWGEGARFDERVVPPIRMDIEWEVVARFIGQELAP